MKAARITLFPVLALLLSSWTGCTKSQKAGAKITDQLGREVQVPAKVDRVVSLWPEATRVLYALGVGDKLVGLDGDSKTCPILTRAFPEIGNVADVGNPVRGTLSIERLAQVKPDIVFVRTDDREVADKIQESLGVPVVATRMHPPLQGRFSYEMISIIGRCVGKEERASKIKEYLKQKLSTVVSVTSKLPEQQRPSVYQAFAHDLLKTIGYFDVIDLAGGKNVAEGSKEAWYTVTLEKVLQWDPDVIILHGFGKFEPRDVLSNPQWQPIRAVKEGKVYKLTLGWTGWDPGGFVINVMANAKAFHPDKFNFNLENEANEIFKELYGVNELYTKLKRDYNLSEVR